MAAFDRGLGHLGDRAAAVGPVRVGVQVAAQQRPQSLTSWGERGQRSLLEMAQLVGDTACGQLLAPLNARSLVETW